MTIKIQYEDRFGEQKEAGVIISSNEVDGELYEVLGIKSEICNIHAELYNLERKLNVDKREGYAIHVLFDSAGHFVWYDYPKRLVLCLARGLWG